jgi:hypothetical protein
MNTVIGHDSTHTSTVKYVRKDQGMNCGFGVRRPFKGGIEEAKALIK